MDLFSPTLPESLGKPMTLGIDWRASVPTVSQLTRRLRGHLENAFFDVWVRGEISGFRKPASGHAYMVLKDAGAQIRVCLFRPTMGRLKFQLEEGMEVLIHGRVSVYEPRGEYQLIGDGVEPVGVGALQLAFDQLKARLEAEGLFLPDHKKTLPLLPKRIGVVTSATGAVIQDIIKVLKRRYPDREILLFPASVQGDRAAGEIVAALKLVERWNAQTPTRAIEVLIVGRGGGSMEDLWPFNEEAVARAIFNCPIPIISAVGHETDFTIADFVADVRAPTPSAAAEMVLPRKEDLVLQVQAMERRLAVSMRRHLDQMRLHLSHLSRRLVSPAQRLAALKQEFEKASARLRVTMQSRLRFERSRWVALGQRLDGLSPLKVLGRGYTLTRKNGKLVRSALQLNTGDTIVTQFADGDVTAEVLSTAPVQG